MPKQLSEIKIFKEGLISNASSADIPDEAATYSSNIDPEVEGGTLGGIAGDRVLTEDGFASNPSVSTYEYEIPHYIQNGDLATYWHQNYFVTGDLLIENRSIIMFNQTGADLSSFKDELTNHVIKLVDDVNLTDIAPWDSTNNKLISISHSTLRGDRVMTMIVSGA